MFCLRSAFIGVDMKSAMEAAAERKKGWAVGVETFPATGAANQTGEDDNNDQQDNPGDKDSSDPRLVVGGVESNHHRRKVGADNNPQRKSPLADFF